MIHILIPAYNPDEKLIRLINDLVSAQKNATIIVVNDGSKAECDIIFNKIAKRKQVILLKNAVNLGKGAALKHGLNYFYVNFPEAKGIVTADADGQHLSDDILKICEKINIEENKLILGVREFHKKIPFRSLLGNLITKIVFSMATGLKVSDTQTGLRGIPKSFIPSILRLKSVKYDFELDMLLITKKNNIPIVEVGIHTVYLENNASSHFNPLLDSMKIYFTLLRYSFVSISSSLLDYIIFIIAYKLTKELTSSYIIARLISSVFNFIGNKEAVFKNKEKLIKPFMKYVLLVLFSGSISYSVIYTLTKYLQFPMIPTKILVETFIFFFNFVIQREFVFKKLR